MSGTPGLLSRETGALGGEQRQYRHDSNLYICSETNSSMFLQTGVKELISESPQFLPREFLNGLYF